MLTSVYCAVGVVWAWLLFYVDTLRGEVQKTMNAPGVVTLKPAASGKKTTRKKQWVETFDINMILNTFRLEDENDYQYEIWLKGFSRILKK